MFSLAGIQHGVVRVLDITFGLIIGWLFTGWVYRKPKCDFPVYLEQQRCTPRHGETSMRDLTYYHVFVLIKEGRLYQRGH